MAVQRVLLADPRGFCAGVEKAIKALAWMVRVFEPPIYCYHEIVHNKVVVDRFKEVGVIFVNDLSEVPLNAPVMLSAHGSAPEIVEQASRNSPISINAVCPLVTKVHHEVKTRAAKGFDIVYVGHKGHDEALGTKAVAPDSVWLIENESELEEISIASDQVALIAQTTLSMDEWADIKEKALARYPELWMPNKSDLCFATTNRQGALREIAHRANTVIVIGSENSSNTVALEKVARGAGVGDVYRINTAAELPPSLVGIVGVTAGASAPDELIDEVIEALAPIEGVETVQYVEEDEYFPPPPELREVLKSAASLLAMACGSELESGAILEGDKDISASFVLSRLGH